MSKSKYIHIICIKLEKTKPSVVILNTNTWVYNSPIVCPRSIQLDVGRIFGDTFPIQFNVTSHDDNSFGSDITPTSHRYHVDFPITQGEGEKIKRCVVVVTLKLFTFQHSETKKKRPNPTYLSTDSSVLVTPPPCLTPSLVLFPSRSA